MTDLYPKSDLQDSFDVLSMDTISDQSNSIYNGSRNGTSNSSDNNFGVSSEVMKLLFIAVTTIIVLICLMICVSTYICICLNRRRNSKRQEHKDQLLLPEQTEKISPIRLSITNSLPKNVTLTLTSNSKQELDKNILALSIQKSTSNLINGNAPLKSYYYDNFDDIPFIDESRPTSYIDITRV